MLAKHHANRLLKFLQNLIQASVSMSFADKPWLPAVRLAQNTKIMQVRRKSVGKLVIRVYPFS